jgi:large subunit ribosomal protein L21
MYAVIKTGGKQERVAEGQRLNVELLSPEGESTDVTFTPILLVDGDDVLAGSAIGDATVTARIVGEDKGPKIRGFTYKNKTNQRKRWGHRQKYTTIEITGIARAGKAGKASAPSEPAEDAGAEG